MYLKISGILKITLLLFFISTNLFSQEKKVQPPEIPALIQKDIERGNVNFDSPAKQEIINLENEMMAAKRSGNIENVLIIQEELNKLTGSVTMPGEKMDLKLMESGKNPIDPDNINNGFISSATGVKGINTCTEQVGATGGRIWSVFVFGPQTGATADRLRLCYKNFGENTWNEWATIGFSAGNRMWQDQIDVELIEDYTGDKYIWVAFGYATNNYAGQYRVGITIVKITGALNFSGFTLNWPGTVNSNYYYRPRIVSDNEAYHPNPWVYITCCFDSAVSGGYQSGEKVAIAYSPYTVTPAITYKPTSFLGLGFIYPSDFHCDIAYFKNGGGDSIMLVESTRGDSSRISIAKSSISSYVSSSTFVGSFNVTVARRYQACIASNGGYNRLMIVNMRKFSPTDWDIEYFVSSSGSTGWSTGYVDYRSNNSTRADIVGFRSAPGVFASAYAEDNLTFVPVSYCSSTNYIWGSIVPQMNHTNTNPFTAQPRPGVSYGPEDENCFAMWTEYSGSTNVWASTGCSGSVNAFRNIFFRGVIEGFWSDPYMVPDTVTLILRNDFAPFEIVDSSKTLVDNDGYGNFWFTNAEVFTNYYIVAKHRNTIETWSASPFQFSSASSSYDFTIASTQAYGNNLIQVPNFPDPLFAFYSGDVNQDGTVDLADLSRIDNDAGNFISGYVNTDVNGDNFADLGDLTIADNNAANFVSIVRP